MLQALFRFFGESQLFNIYQHTTVQRRFREDGSACTFESSR